jgi:hypothetical protein
MYSVCMYLRASVHLGSRSWWASMLFIIFIMDMAKAMQSEEKGMDRVRHA